MREVTSSCSLLHTSTAVLGVNVLSTVQTLNSMSSLLCLLAVALISPLHKAGISRQTFMSSKGKSKPPGKIQTDLTYAIKTSCHKWTFFPHSIQSTWNLLPASLCYGSQFGRVYSRAVNDKTHNCSLDFLQAGCDSQKCGIWNWAPGTAKVAGLTQRHT